jgi:DNA-binding winged helix-turn-helix (wHTH) protein
MRTAISKEAGPIYEFGDYRLDTSAKVLVRGGEPVALTPKVFDTLQYLMEHAGRLLEKDELMENLWHDRFVEDNNLTFNIKVLRRALHDDAHQPRFIETVPDAGIVYRFERLDTDSGNRTFARRLLLPTESKNLLRSALAT